MLTHEDMQFIENLFRSLEREMRGGFEASSARFDEVGAEFTELKARLDRMDARLMRLDRTVGAGIRQVANLTEWSEKQDQFQNDIIRRVLSLEDRVKKLEEPNGKQ